MTRDQAIHEGRARPTCLGCDRAHGGVVEHIRCLEETIRREREHPDRLRGRAAREAFEAWEARR